MRRYDPVDQRTTEDIDALVIYPASEVLLATKTVHAFMAGKGQAAASDVLAGPPSARDG